MFLSLAALSVALCARPASAWDQHRELTRLALEQMPSLDGAATVETLQAYLASTGFKGSEKDFIRALRLNPATSFPFSAGEAAGGAVPLRTVLERYSDEPDGGMDENLFAAYPELWKDDYRYLGPEVYTTRAFRHIYWIGGFYKAPQPPSTTPIHDPAILGDAPERAEIFFVKAQEAFRAGHPYWAARFLAWSLHYVEDLTQPFHAAELPSFAYLRLRPDATLDVEKTARFVMYYHLALDAFPVKAAEGALGAPMAARVRKALAGAGASSGFRSARRLAEEAARRAAAGSADTAERMLDFFPPARGSALTDPYGRVTSPGFWKLVLREQQEDPAVMEGFALRVESLLGAAGEAARTLVAEALKAVPPPPPRRLDLPAPASLLRRPQF